MSCPLPPAVVRARRYTSYFGYAVRRCSMPPRFEPCRPAYDPEPVLREAMRGARLLAGLVVAAAALAVALVL